MYDHADHIQKELDTFELGFNAKLDPENRWVVKAAMIPWDELEPEYTHHFSNLGRPSKRFRVALGTLIIQETLKLTDRETIQQISENPYLQFFLGFKAFSPKVPFDASVLVYFRKRLEWTSLKVMNDKILGAKKVARTEDHSNDDEPKAGPNQSVEEKKPEPVQGVLKLDATCVPSDIRHPHDLSLLDEARRKTEKIIDILHRTVAGEKPRTYRRKARRQFLLAVKKRNKTPEETRKAIGKQLRYLKRNLSIVNGMEVLAGQTDALSRQLQVDLATVRTLYEQQRYLYTHRTHSVPDRIVSIRMPFVRPIVRGKTRSETEFGPKISVSTIKGYVFIDRMSFNAYHEGKDLKAQAEAYKQRTGYYPEKILADRAYQTRENRSWCNERNIQLMGEKQGRPFDDERINRLFKKVRRMDQRSRVEIEGRIGIQKRRYGWDCVRGRLEKTSMTMIMVSAIAANLEQKLRKLLLSIFVFAQMRCCTLLARLNEYPRTAIRPAKTAAFA